MCTDIETFIEAKMRKKQEKNYILTGDMFWKMVKKYHLIWGLGKLWTSAWTSTLSKVWVTKLQTKSVINTPL